MKIAKECPCCLNDNLKSSPAILMPFIAHRAFGHMPVDIDDSWGLRSIKNGWAYSLCRSMMCTHCLHVFCDIRFDDEEMRNIYDDYRGIRYVSLREFHEPGYKDKNDKLNLGYNYVHDVEEFLKDMVRPNPHVLDWGGDTGKNTPFKKEAYLHHVFDVSNARTMERVRRVDKEEMKKNAYDLIVLANVLEHVPYPQDTLDEIRFYMKTKTVLYIEVPLENLVNEHFGDDMHKLKKHWHEHINFFNQTSLRRLLDDFEILSFRTLPITGESSDHVFQVACRKT